LPLVVFLFLPVFLKPAAAHLSNHKSAYLSRDHIFHLSRLLAVHENTPSVTMILNDFLLVRFYYHSSKSLHVTVFIMIARSSHKRTPSMIEAWFKLSKINSISFS
jgi:hypothetical protein